MVRSFFPLSIVGALLGFTRASDTCEASKPFADDDVDHPSLLQGLKTVRAVTDYRQSATVNQSRSHPGYIGCFIDDDNRDLQVHVGGGVHTTSSCMAACSSFNYYALQSNGECRCGNAYSTESQYVQRPDAECGGASCIEEGGSCGGGWRNAVYRGPQSPSHPGYIGCFTDDNNRDMQAGPRVHGHTTFSCMAACSSFNYYALQNNGECRCGNAYSTASQYDQRPDAECGVACAGEGGGVCGRGWRNAVYRVPHAQPDEASFLGCYRDDASRDLKDGPRTYGFTTRTCSAACSSYNYFALQHNGQCFCGDDYGTGSQYSVVPDTQCGNPCANEDSGRCGGGYRNAIYTHRHIAFKGCFVDDAARDVAVGPRNYGYTTETCREACASYNYFALQNNGWCVCGNEYGTASQYRQVADHECGSVCAGENSLVPSRRCGGGWRNAIYSTAVGPHLGHVGANTCDDYTVGLTEYYCHDAVQNLIIGRETQGGPDLVGSWGSVPPGCSVQSEGDWSAYYNRHVGGDNNGGYTPVCSGVHQGNRGSNTCGTSVGEGQCLAAVQVLLPEGVSQGRTILVFSGKDTPLGCSVQSGGDWAAHYNRGWDRDVGSNDGLYSPVCYA